MKRTVDLVPSRRMEHGFAHLVLILIAVGALVVGTGVFLYGRQKDDAPLMSAAETDPVSLTKPLPGDLLSVDKVRELAKGEKPDLAVSQIELESEGQTLLYKVRLSDGSFLLYNARSGVKVTKQVRAPAEVEKDDSLPAHFTAAISFEKAREVALKQKPGGIVRKIELETEGGKVVYSVRFTDDSRVDVDATTGAVVGTRQAAASGSKSGSGSPTASPTTPVSGSGSSGSGSGSGTSGTGSVPTTQSGDDSDHDGSHDSGDDHSGSGSGSGTSGSGHSGGSDDD